MINGKVVVFINKILICLLVICQEFKISFFLGDKVIRGNIVLSGVLSLVNRMLVII